MMIFVLPFPYVTMGLLAMLLGAIFCSPRFPRINNRRVGLSLLTFTLLMFLFALVKLQWQKLASYPDPLLPQFKVDAVDGLPLVVFLFVVIIAVCLAPRRDIRERCLSGIFLLVMGTTMIYASDHLWIVNVGWWLNCVPFVGAFFGKTPDRKQTSVMLMASAILLTLSTAFLHASQWASVETITQWSMFFFVATLIVRKGLFPFHGWTLQSFEKGPLLPKAVLFNSHLGALLVLRAQSSGMSVLEHPSLEWLSLLALVTALITSLRGLIEKKPRRLMAFVCISQASFILSGLLATNAEGVMGGMLHWAVVALASTSLIAIVRILEVRVIDVADPTAPLGLAVRAPRLAVFFLLSGLALVGLPGTMGYCAEDLLFHGVQDHHSVMGVALLLATAINAINLMRLHSVLFLGVLPKNVIEVPDALPRERWPLTVLVVLLVMGGLYPRWPIALRQEAVKAIPLRVNDLPHHADGLH
jgi:NADH-quinone oxidoreductase subunit M